MSNDLDSILEISPSNKDKKPLSGIEGQEVQSLTPLFLYIPVSRLIILSIISFGIYEAYWIYKNWQYIKERDNLNIQPFWRGIFGVFFCHSLLRRIHDDKEARSMLMPSFSPDGLASGWVILVILANLITRLPGIAASIISAFIPAFLFIIPVQNYINSATEKRSSDSQFYKWSTGHMVCLLLGIFIWLMLLIGLSSLA